ncbi:MAG: hypothetical protein AB1705_07205 [Verrucomicrobiota bacterium]
MILSVGFVTTLFAWCVWKVLCGTEPVDKLHSLDSIDTKDTEKDS